MSNNRTTIIIRGKGGGPAEHGSHGMWKIAYADFMTAMMAFFLMMWLTGSVAENVRKGLSVYFAPLGASQNVLGTDSILEGGKNLEESGLMDGMVQEEYIFPKVPDYSVVQKKNVTSKTWEKQSGDTPSSNHASEQLILEAAEKTLRSGLLQNNQLKDFSDSVVITLTPEGLKIELIDKASRHMFSIGSKKMEQHMEILLKEIARVIQILPNLVRITGHTDARQYSQNSQYNNWNLSTDRALASRQFLQEHGVEESKFSGVVGKANNELLDESNPFSESNRRISIIVLRKEKEELAGR